MKEALNCLYLFFIRFRYPVALPQDIAMALGVEIPKYVTFKEFVKCVTDPNCSPTRLEKFMPRDEAESVFNKAQRKEKFKKNTLFSFYFNEGWLEFNLEFDSNARLRKIYVLHKIIEQDRGIEIPLTN